MCPTKVGQLWASLLNDVKKQMSEDCVKLRWLKEQYLYLYYLDEACRGPLAADAIEVFGGRSWTPTGESKEHHKSSTRKVSGLYGVKSKKKMSYGNIHPLNRRGIHEDSSSLSSPLSSPATQRRSLASVPHSFMLSPLMTRSASLRFLILITAGLMSRNEYSFVFTILERVSAITKSLLQ